MPEPLVEDPLLDPVLEAPLVELAPDEPIALEPEPPFVDEPPELPPPWLVPLDPVEVPDDAPPLVEPLTPLELLSVPKDVLLAGELHAASNAEANTREPCRTVVIAASSLSSPRRGDLLSEPNMDLWNEVAASFHPVVGRTFGSHSHPVL